MIDDHQTEDTEPASTSATSGNESSSAPESPTTPRAAQGEEEEDMEMATPHASPAKWTVSWTSVFLPPFHGTLLDFQIESTFLSLQLIIAGSQFHEFDCYVQYL